MLRTIPTSPHQINSVRQVCAHLQMNKERLRKTTVTRPGVQRVGTAPTTARPGLLTPTLSCEPLRAGEDTEVLEPCAPTPRLGACLVLVEERLVPPAPAMLPAPYAGAGVSALPWAPGQWGKWAGGHPLGITWRWDSAGAGGEGQLASAAWSPPGWLGSPRLWGSG